VFLDFRRFPQIKIKSAGGSGETSKVEWCFSGFSDSVSASRGMFEISAG
jgi:hypothetical protein